MDMIIVVGCFDEHNFLGRDIFSGLLIRITDRLNCLKISFLILILNILRRQVVNPLTYFDINGRRGYS
jgi:hypothetical protein